VLAVSESVASQFLDRNKVKVLHNGLDLSEFDVPRQSLGDEFRQRWGLGNQFVVGCVGRIKWVRKGQETLVRAAAVLERKGLPAKYVIVGSVYPGNESHEHRLRELIRELGLEEKVILTGEISDTRSVYPGLDVLVLPSGQPEPLGGVVLEAMAMGVPVIATCLGGSPDMVVDGVTGFLVPPHDPQALAERIEVLMNDPALKNRMKDSGPKRIEQHFSLRNTVRELETIYAEALR
jgi:glycosyltransferase involved in cell wall biosynthesis